MGGLCRLYLFIAAPALAGQESLSGNKIASAFSYNFVVAPKASADLTQAFAALVRSDVEDENVDLLRAALTFARIEEPQLDIERYVLRVAELAARVAARIQDPDDPGQVIAALNQVLFQEEMFRGNTADYYNARNSFLHRVLDERTGIPISLALVYMEVGRRIGFPLFGVGMPGHFLLKHYDVDGRAILIDAFERGSIVTEEDCRQKLNDIYSGQLALQPEFLLPVTRRQMLTRMLNNLRSIYLSQRDFRHALQVVDLILVIYPRSPEDVKQRAVLRYNLNDYRGALNDFEEYVKMTPDASDADEIRQTALSLRRSMAMMN
jgi:regulator of sirC expression with transglutaminase-like and TPR domain